MECNVVKDLIPLYVDDCCSEESGQIVWQHMEKCSACKKLYETMKEPSVGASVSPAPMVMSKLNDWKASILQSVLLFAAFAVITLGVALEAATPEGLTNGYWAISLVIPATGFLLSLANWYFVRLYKSRKSFSNSSLLTTLGFTVCGYIWAVFHYGVDISQLLQGAGLAYVMDLMQGVAFYCGIGILLSVALCILSKLLSNLYAKMLGKE